MKFNLIEKISGVLKLEPKIYKSLESEKNNLKTSFFLILFISLVTSLIYKSYFFDNLNIKIPIIFLVGVWVFLNWYFLSNIIYFFATKAFPEKNTPKIKCYSIIAFSYLPELLKVLIFVSPKFILVTSWGSFIWVIACQVIGLREIYKFKSLWKSLFVIIISYIVQILSVVIFLTLILNLSN